MKTPGDTSSKTASTSKPTSTKSALGTKGKSPSRSRAIESSDEYEEEDEFEAEDEPKHAPPGVKLEVKGIKKHRSSNGNVEYLVSWVGTDERSWIQEDDFTSTKILNSYWRSLPASRQMERYAVPEASQSESETDSEVEELPLPPPLPAPKRKILPPSSKSAASPSSSTKPRSLPPSGKPSLVTSKSPSSTSSATVKRPAPSPAKSQEGSKPKKVKILDVPTEAEDEEEELELQLVSILKKKPVEQPRVEQSEAESGTEGEREQEEQELAPPAPKKKRGRPSKAASVGARTDTEYEDDDEDNIPLPKKKRGRPKKVKEAQAETDNDEESGAPPVKRKRGRPKLHPEVQTETEFEDGDAPPPVKRGRGRPKLTEEQKRARREAARLGLPNHRKSDASVPESLGVEGVPKKKKPGRPKTKGVSDDGPPIVARPASVEAPAPPVVVLSGGEEDSSEDEAALAAASMELSPQQSLSDKGKGKSPLVPIILVPPPSKSKSSPPSQPLSSALPSTSAGSPSTSTLPASLALLLSPSTSFAEPSTSTLPPSTFEEPSPSATVSSAPPEADTEPAVVPSLLPSLSDNTTDPAITTPSLEPAPTSSLPEEAEANLRAISPDLEVGDEAPKRKGRGAGKKPKKSTTAETKAKSSSVAKSKKAAGGAAKSKALAAAERKAEESRKSTNAGLGTAVDPDDDGAMEVDMDTASDDDEDVVVVPTASTAMEALSPLLPLLPAPIASTSTAVNIPPSKPASKTRTTSKQSAAKASGSSKIATLSQPHSRTMAQFVPIRPAPSRSRSSALSIDLGPIGSTSTGLQPSSAIPAGDYETFEGTGEISPVALDKHLREWLDNDILRPPSAHSSTSPPSGNSKPFMTGKYVSLDSRTPTLHTLLPAFDGSQTVNHSSTYTVNPLPIPSTSSGFTRAAAKKALAGSLEESLVDREDMMVEGRHYKAHEVKYENEPFWDPLVKSISGMELLESGDRIFFAVWVEDESYSWVSEQDARHRCAQKLIDFLIGLPQFPRTTVSGASIST